MIYIGDKEIIVYDKNGNPIDHFVKESDVGRRIQRLENDIAYLNMQLDDLKKDKTS